MLNNDMFWQLFFWLSTAIALIVIFGVHRSACKALMQASLANHATIDNPTPQQEEKE